MDDLISRKELRKAFKESGYFTNAWLHWARLLIDQAPTVNPFPDAILEAYLKISDQEFEHSNGFWIMTPKGKKIYFEKKRPQGEWIPIEKEDDLIDHYWYLIAHEDYKTPIKAKYHSDVPHFTFSANSEEHASYIFEGKITHYMDLPELPKKKGGAENETDN